MAQKPKSVVMSECVHVRLPPALYTFVKREAKRDHTKPIDYIRGLIKAAYDRAAGQECR